MSQYVEGEGYYDFTGETKVVDGVTVRQIVATRDLPKFNVEAGRVGGYIQSRHNLLGGSWVKGNAVVMENATLDQGAFAGGHARVRGNSRVFGSVAIIHEGKVPGDSVILQLKLNLTREQPSLSPLRLPSEMQLSPL